MTVTLILVVILICIKVTHFVIIERPLKQCRIVSAYHLTVDTNGAQIDQSWLFEKDDLTYIDIAKTFEQTYFVTDYAGGSGDSGALNELTIAFGETMNGMPDIRITVSENGYIQINGKRAYPLSLKYAGKRLYVPLAKEPFSSFGSVMLITRICSFFSAFSVPALAETSVICPSTGAAIALPGIAVAITVTASSTASMFFLLFIISTS